MGVINPDYIIRSIIPVVMRIYGLIVAVILVQNISENNYSDYDGYKHLASGLCCGLSSLAGGMAIGVVGDAGVRANSQQSKIFVGMILILIFAEALGLYGLIVALILSQ
jgi:V-type H+-transporting ATPase proteolipid subunit